MTNITSVTLTGGIPTAGTGNVSTIDNLISVGLPISNSLPVGNNYVGGFSIQDGSGGTSNRVLVAAFHNADNQQLGTVYGLNTGGVAQLLNPLGNIDRQRGTGLDNTPATGISTGVATSAMYYKTISNTVSTISSGINTVYPVAMSGNNAGVSWSIQTGSVLQIGQGTANAETIIVTSANTTAFTATFAYAHPTSTTITGFTYNQGRDAAGEVDGASGAGTSLAAGYEYNGGDPSGGNFDRERSVNAKGFASFTISSGGTNGSKSLVLSSTPTGLAPGMKVLLANNANMNTATHESVQIDLSYIPGSTTVPLASAIVNTPTGGYTQINYDIFKDMGPGLSGFLPFGMGIEEEAVYDPLSNMFYLERSATQDGISAQNVVIENPGLWNGATIDRARSAPGTIGVEAVSSDGTKLTYRYSSLSVTPVATPTDFLFIQGSASKTIRIKRIKLSGVATANGNMPVQLIRRSTLFTTQGSATFTSVTAGKHDVNDASATANVAFVQTANFTSVGTAVGGNIAADRLQMLAVGSAIGSSSLTWDFSTRQDKALILRGTSDIVYINFNGSAIPTGGVVDFEIETEEDNS